MTWIFTPYEGDQYIKVIGSSEDARKYMNQNYSDKWELQLTEHNFRFMEYLYSGCSKTITL